MNRQARDLMMQAPAPVPADRLDDVHIRRAPPPAPKPADG
jgi:aspartyl-tRNA synthetase